MPPQQMAFRDANNSQNRSIGTPEEGNYPNAMPLSAFHANTTEDSQDPNKNAETEIVLPIVKSPLNH